MKSFFKFLVIFLFVAALVVGGIELFKYLDSKEEGDPPNSDSQPPSSPENPQNPDENTGDVTTPSEPTGPPHVHLYVEARVDDAFLASKATCLSPATYYYICSCEKIGTETYEDGKVGPHTMENGVCTVCNKGESSGLIFTPNPYDEEDPDAIRTCTLSGVGACLDTDLIIPSVSPDGMTVTSIGYAAFEDNSTIESIIIPSSVIRISEYAFKNASALRTVYILEGSSLERIGTSAFENCDALEEIKLPEGLTLLGKRAFYDCNSLIYIKFPSTLETIPEKAFYLCFGLNSITLPEGVKVLEANAFSSCYYLSNVDLPDTLQEIGDCAFANTMVSSVTIPQNVRNIYKSAFLGCNSLEAVTAHTDNTTYFSLDGVLFRRSDKELIIYPYAKITENLTLPDGVKTISAETFLNHQKLISVTLPASVTKIEDGAFFGCSQLESITFPENSMLTEIGMSAFSHCKSLKSVVIPKGVTLISQSAFESCEALSEVTIPYGVTTICSYVFSGCTSLRTINIPESVTVIEAFAFKYTGLRSVTIPRSVTACGGAFIECEQLTEVRVAADNFHYKSIDGVLYTADGKNLVLYPSGRPDKSFIIPSSVEIVEEFLRCVALESVFIPASVDTFFGFSFCPNLRRVTFSEDCNSVNLGCLKLEGCPSIESIALPNGVNGIGSRRFIDCPNLVSVTIPTDVKEIYNEAFINCPSLRAIIYEGTIAQWNEIDFESGWDMGLSDYTVYCTDGNI